jgi:hypothetical protein
MEWKIEFTINTARQSLAESLAAGPILNDQGMRFLPEHTVARVNGLKIEVFSNEHPPPHFRVIYQGETANYSIEDCEKLNGGLSKFDRNIRKWHEKHKQDLVSAWNTSRPSNCPVGPVQN